jgi:hypothetical protein
VVIKITLLQVHRIACDLRHVQSRVFSESAWKSLPESRPVAHREGHRSKQIDAIRRMNDGKQEDQTEKGAGTSQRAPHT